MERNRPLVDVITDGSGPDRPPRFASTEKLIVEAGGRLGFLAGGFSDRAFYELILAGNPEPLIGLSRQFAAEWAAAEIEVVAGDMLEGFSTTHDVCRMMINAAVIKLRARGQMVLNLEFPLESMRQPGMAEGSQALRLDDAAFLRKRQAATLAYPELTGEVDRLMSKYGEDAFRVEVLLPATVSAGLTWEGAEPPFYESYGRKQVAAGHYQNLITYAGHIQPLARALDAWAHSEGD